MRSNSWSGLLGLSSAALLVASLPEAGRAALAEWVGTPSVHLQGMSGAGSGTGSATVGVSGGNHLDTLSMRGGLTTTLSATQPGSSVTKVFARLTGPTGPAVGSVGTATFAGSIGIKRSGAPMVFVPITGVLGGAGTAMGSNGTTMLTPRGSGWTTQSAVAMSIGATQIRTGFARGPPQTPPPPRPPEASSTW